MEGFDAVIIGGGPAGAATAIALARRGLTAAIVERDGAPRPRVGETLPPSARAPLEALGVWPRFAAAGHEPAAGNRSCWGSDAVQEAHFIRSPYGSGWHLDRPRFESMLLEAAEELGVVVVRGAQLDALSCDGLTWWARAGRWLKAAFAVDASGRNAFLARASGAERVSIDRLVGVALFLGAKAGERDPEGTFTLIEAVEEGWWYSASLPGGRLVVTLMTDGDLAARATLRDLEGWRAAARRTGPTRRRLEAYSAPETPPHVWSANTARLSSVVGPAWLAAGDAAVSVDPLSSQGISTALEAGLEAAQAIQAHLGGDPAALSRYAAAVTARYRDYLVERARYYGAEPRWPDSPFWRRRQGHRAPAEVTAHAAVH
ncbi:MAG TPA: tryptophan 7-halogenase [Myxococcales bacterium]|nr:tryptophan 7-halogenase [Myxococcales bacterium]